MPPDFLILLLSTLFGLIIGSFLTACIFRIPYGRPQGPPNLDDDDEEDIVEPPEDRKNYTLLNPRRSICPHCLNQLLWWHNIPVISWFLLRGRCGFCKVKIPFRYPLVEILSGASAFLAVFFFGFNWTSFILFGVFAALIVISFIDIDYYIIPDVISLPATCLGLFVSALNGVFHFAKWPVNLDIYQSLIGVVFGAGSLFALAELYYLIRKKVGLGLGDVKLLGVFGAFFGLEGAFFGLFLGSLCGSIFGVIQMTLFRKGLSHPLPFGPYLVMGVAAYIFIVGPRALGF